MNNYSEREWKAVIARNPASRDDETYGIAPLSLSRGTKGSQ